MTAHETINFFHRRSENKGAKGQRLYTKWSSASHRYKNEDYGRDSMYPEMMAWLRYQGANPGDMDKNGGRKASGALCDEYGVPYEHSVEWHANYAKNWRRYQPNVRRPPGFERREQSQNDRDCLIGQEMILAAWGRGRLAGKMPPHVPRSERVPKREHDVKVEKKPKKEEEKAETIDLTRMQTDVSVLKSGMTDLRNMVRMLLDRK